MQDKMAILQVIGSIVQKPELLLDDKYQLSTNDFPERFHQIVFSAISNLINSGVNIIGVIEVDNYISNYEKQYKIYNDNNGMEYLENAINLSIIKNFEYNYNRLKKFSLLNQLKENGFDITEIYDENIIDIKTQEEMQQEFDKMDLNDIINYFDKKIIDIKAQYYDEEGQIGQQAGKNMLQLKEDLKETPEMGAPLNGNILNTIVRGARLKKVYMRSSPTGGGKTRLAVGDICKISIPWFYDLKEKKWIFTTFSEPSLFITTELEIEEIQTLIMAYISGVDEAHILDGKYENDEEERVNKAVEYINNAPLWIEQIPNFNIDDIERTIKRYKINKNIGYVFFDYIFTSVKMLIEITTKTKGMKLREDNILYIFIERMKFTCNKLNIHFDTSSQLNGEWKNVKDGDQNLLRGCKALGDKLDFGCIALPVTKKDLEMLHPILSHGFYKLPNLVYHIYKVRRGKFVKVKLWIYADFGTCRTEDLFLTNNDYELIPIESTTIEKILEMTEDTDPIEEANEDDEDDNTPFDY
jgi:replicative DNA helicase